MARLKGIFIKRCGNCGSKRVRIVPNGIFEPTYRCEDCDKRAKLLREKGLTEKEIMKIINV